MLASRIFKTHFNLLNHISNPVYIMVKYNVCCEMGKQGQLFIFSMSLIFGSNIRLRLGRCEQVLDVLPDVVGQEGFAVADDGHTLSVHEELLEVPAHVGHLQTLVVQTVLAGERLPRGRAVGLEVRVQRVFVRPVHIDLLRQLKVGLKTVSRSNVLERVEDLSSVVPWLLEGELVTWDAEDLEVFEAVLECIQGGVLGRRPSEGGHVDH